MSLQKIGKRSPSIAKKSKGCFAKEDKQRTCFMCRRYESDYRYTTYMCPDCGTPLCRPDYPRGRDTSCVFEHKHSKIAEIRCDGKEKKKLPSPLRLW